MGVLGATTLLFEESKFVMPVASIVSKSLNNIHCEMSQKYKVFNRKTETREEWCDNNR